MIVTLSNQIRTLLAIMSGLFSKRLGVMTPDVDTPEASLQSRMTFPVRVFSKMRPNTFNLDDNGFSPNQTEEEKINKVSNYTSFIFRNILYDLGSIS